ncbi:MAG: acetyl-CoA carboxylase biotin carboxyl carrier protein [Armatimonadota bacterium]
MTEDVDIKQVEELVKLVEEHNLAELTVEEHGTTITVKGVVEHQTHIMQIPQGSVPHELVYPFDAVEHEEAFEEHSTETVDSSDLITIESPMVGVFYRAQSPDIPPFVEIGDIIEIGQTIGLIEAMKVFSEIPAEVAGEVVDVPVDNGKLVQQGQPLIVIRPVP